MNDVVASDKLPDDAQMLKAMLRETLTQHEAALRHFAEQQRADREALSYRDEEIERLKGQIKLLLAQRFAPSSEKVSDAQLGLFNEAEHVLDDEASADDHAGDDGPGDAPKARRRGKRRPLPASLRRTEMVHDLAPEQRICPHDGTELEVVGDECSEQLVVVPAHMEVIVHKRLKYACPCCRGHMDIAPMPPQPIPKSMASAELLAFVATGKYVDALPLHRQSRQFERIDIDLPTQTLARWMIELGRLFTPLTNLLRDEMLSQTYMQMDESVFQVLKEPGRTAEAQSRLWVQRAMDPGRPVVLFSYREERSGAVAKALMGDFQGIRHSDGYGVYENPPDGIVAAHCWAHVRRHFTDGLKSLGINPKRLPQGKGRKGKLLMSGLRYIRELYAIETGLKGATVDERQRVRADKSAKVLQRLDDWRNNKQPLTRPGSDIGKAFAYIERYWDGLCVFLSDGRVLLDTNLVEGEIRPFAVGRRNWMFAATPRGAHASAAIYSVISTAKANGLEPYAYLRHVIARLPAAETVADIEALLPWHLKTDALNAA